MSKQIIHNTKCELRDRDIRVKSGHLHEILAALVGHGSRAAMGICFSQVMIEGEILVLDKEAGLFRAEKLVGLAHSARVVDELIEQIFFYIHGKGIDCRVFESEKDFIEDYDISSTLALKIINNEIVIDEMAKTYGYGYECDNIKLNSCIKSNDCIHFVSEISGKIFPDKYFDSSRIIIHGEIIFGKHRNMASDYFELVLKAEQENTRDPDDLW